MKRRTTMAMAGGLVAAIVTAGALAHGAGAMQGRGGHGGMGPGMMQGHGGHHGGMGPGMMQGHGGHHGGMGPGMMHGHGGMGAGMMGGMGPGGMMRGGISPYEAGVLGLDADQQRRLEDIQREAAREHWQLMQEQHRRRGEMMQLYRGEGAPEPEALGEAYGRMADAQRRMLEHRARVHQRMRAVLTEEQRERLEQMRRFGRGGYGG